MLDLTAEQYTLIDRVTRGMARAVPRDEIEDLVILVATDCATAHTTDPSYIRTAARRNAIDFIRVTRRHPADSLDSLIHDDDDDNGYWDLAEPAPEPRRTWDLDTLADWIRPVAERVLAGAQLTPREHRDLQRYARLHTA